MEYASVEQRMASAYLAMFPSFVPKTCAEVSAAEQRTFYDLMRGLYQRLFDDPTLLFPSLHEDDAFPTRYKKGYGKPKLEANISKIKRTVESLLETLFLLGRGDAVEPNKRQLKLLAMMGIDDVRALPSAWTWMATRPDANPIAFAYCLFDETYVYASDVYARLLEEAPFRKLEAWMVSQGYKAYDQYNIDFPNYQLTLTYANPAWGGERPNAGNEYRIRHTGISAQYDAYVSQPASFGLCIPNGLKPFLERFDEMPPSVRDFVVERTKKCDGCRYCVQTDKTGARPLACMPITHRQTEYRLCPYFPGYAYAWTQLDDALVERLIEMLAFMDGFAQAGTRRAT